MSWILRANAPIAVLLFLGTSAPAVAQDIDACPEQGRAARLVAPQAIAHGRSDFFYLERVDEGRSENRTFDRRTVVAKVGPVAGGRFAKPFEAPFRRGWLVQASRGDDSARVVVRFREFSKGTGRADRCLRVLRKRIRIIAGELPELGAKVDEGRLVVDLRGSGICSDLRLAPVGFRLRGRGVDEALRVSEPCGDWDRGRLRAGALAVSTQDETAFAYPLLRIRGRPLDAHRRRTFFLSARSAGERVGGVRFRVTWRAQRRRVVFEDEDRFVNYCRREARPIRSEGGRRYCVRPAGSAVRIELLKR